MSSRHAGTRRSLQGYTHHATLPQLPDVMTTDELRSIGVTDFAADEFYPPPSVLPVAMRKNWHIQPVATRGIQTLRTLVDAPVWVNTWAGGPGDLQARGVRLPTSSVGATYSQHKRGLAVDFHVPSWTPEDVWDFILERQVDFLRVGITTLESIDATAPDGWGWIHMDARYSAAKHLQIVFP